MYNFPLSYWLLNCTNIQKGFPKPGRQQQLEVEELSRDFRATWGRCRWLLKFCSSRGAWWALRHSLWPALKEHILGLRAKPTNRPDLSKTKTNLQKNKWPTWTLNTFKNILMLFGEKSHQEPLQFLTHDVSFPIRIIK